MWLRKIVGICLFSLAWLTCIAETFDSRFASLEVDANGKVISLREKPSGRELGGGATPMMTVVLNSMKRGASESFRKVDAGRYAVGFKGIAGKVILEIKTLEAGGRSVSSVRTSHNFMRLYSSISSLFARRM